MMGLGKFWEILSSQGELEFEKTRKERGERRERERVREREGERERENMSYGGSLYICPKRGCRTRAIHIIWVGVMKAIEKKFGDYHVLNNEQHGFRSGRSCLTQLLEHYDAILEDLNQGWEVDVAYIDFSKAFDKVDINILLHKLKRYGVRGRLLQWIRAFLTGRSQTVVIDGVCSRAESVTSSVIQGSVLGPRLFIIYVCDLASRTTGGYLIWLIS
eukprot:sb/3469945/